MDTRGHRGRFRPGTSLQKAITASTIVLLLLIAASPLARAQIYTVLHNFTAHQDGGGPFAGLTIDRAGNLYGTAPYGGYFGGSCGGQGGCGVVFKLTNRQGTWIFTPLYLYYWRQ